MILVVDTSLVGAQMALIKQQPKPVWRGAHLDNSGSLPAISRLFAAAGAEARALTGVAVSVGPGSFTGIKVGLAFVYGLVAARRSLGLPLPVFGTSALGAAANRLRRVQGTAACGVLLPATRTHGFFAVATEAGGSEQLVHTAPAHERFTPEASLALRLAAQAADLPLRMAAGWGEMQAALTQLGRQYSEITMENLCDAALLGMCERVAAAYPDAFGAELPPPRYLRLSTAEEALGAAASPAIV